MSFLDSPETATGRTALDYKATYLRSALGFRLLLLTGCQLSEIQFLSREHVKDCCIELRET